MANTPDGFRFLPTYLDRAAQEQLLAEVHAVIAAAPLFTPSMPRTGQPFSIRMTNCGPLGWVSDTSGYRYQPTHPVTGAAWPAMPAVLLRLWEDLAGGYPHPPEACLINVYGDKTAKLGMHRDMDEQDMDAPVVSLSLGDSCLFRIGGTRREHPVSAIQLGSGAAVVLGGDSRLAFHGVARVMCGTSDLLPGGGRINLTLRRVTRPIST